MKSWGRPLSFSVSNRLIDQEAVSASGSVRFAIHLQRRKVSGFGFLGLGFGVSGSGFSS